MKKYMKKYVKKTGQTSNVNLVHLKWWSGLNLGDTLSPVVFVWMLEQKGHSPMDKAKKTIDFLGIGSIIGFSSSDAVIWGSGIISQSRFDGIYKKRNSIQYDIRAVRGPVTKTLLEACGYDCKGVVYGDPAILMPKIYYPKTSEKKYKCSLILHHSTGGKERYTENYHCIPVETDDYKSFIDEIVASELIVSSSLHGIILAETYGVPAVLLNENGFLDKQIMKFFDWYFSTGRSDIVIANSVEKALQLKPMDIPTLTEMQEALIHAFPYDYWE